MEINKNFILIFIIAFVPLSGIGVDVFAPSLPHIATYFSISNSLAKLSIPLYIMGLGIASLFFGVWSDSVGRKRPLIIGLLAFIIISLLAASASNIYWLLGLRFLQGIAAAAPGAILRALVPDTFSGKERNAATNTMTIAWALGPILAPVIGGYLQAYFNWRAPLWFLMCYGSMMLFITITLLPETKQEFQPRNFQAMKTNILKFTSDKVFLAGIFCLAIFASFIFIFNILGPFIIQKELHYSAIQYGHFALLIGLFWFLGNLSNRVLIKFFQKEKIILTAIICALMSSFSMTVLALFGFLNIWALLLPIGVTLFFSSIAFPNAYGICLGRFPHLGGTASALMGSLSILSASIIGIFSILLKTSSLLPISLLYFILLLLNLLVCYHFLLKPQKIQGNKT